MKFNEVTGMDERIILHVFEEGYLQAVVWDDDFKVGSSYYLHDVKGEQLSWYQTIDEALNQANLRDWTELRLPEVKFLFFTEDGDQFTFDTEKEAYLWAARAGAKGRIEKHIV